MSTIASPRDPTSSFRRTNSSQAIATPTSSARPSLDIPRSATSSPIPGSGPFQPAPNKRNNRAALREYYNLKKTSAASAAPPLLEVTDTDSVGDAAETSYSEVPLSEIDAAGFDADAYVKAKLQESSLDELLRTYTRVLGEIRALGAEKKALVYDNYSKLITATETIRKMRANMDPLNPMASTLDPAIAQIYSQASSIRESLRKSASKPEDSTKAYEDRAKKTRTKELVSEVLEAPERIRALAQAGKTEEAEEAWRLPRQLLLRWKERGLGGADIDVCLAEGEAALKDETAPET
ncbi:hypothetical protein M406DRAFT_293428 [Cryphonectria parasitica EP155]|uniref:Vacuolar protein sorting-associated protein 51 homolog n=1 Tax=Cryphonectria parasitica (strain ATCC 38755 / EP155) TaxID=660469 RepID=A0A9P4XZA9_CRYP1|nr:uncharacterized protein M406DRAFT_293428 [Cryphonectria parasitica EP155]KAF3763768.1 hypothetical protein M406DRAFT_293428 [Cryphonectria parasitica EP155]